ncbi:hypothetical protein HK103_003622 [Boothiomyces macroporosus]|uniref:Large ribosomal subunit protein uL11m n=1 Tax=Boothiomyces macroporosus TaxID=261099 RepID=A0AAD5Y6B6_9FUNG|nr:hypothetical protein HK103_003622 [Boothiomyces macroporosus]
MSKPLAVAQTIKLIIPAGKATPTPPVGPALGQKGVKSMDFCKQFNDRTKIYIPGIPISCRITVQPDKTFSFFTRSPPTSWLLLQALGLEKGSSKPGIEKIGQLSLKHIYAIAQIKQKDPAFEKTELKAVASQIVGTARNMGIDIIP